jgi:2-polyprenyl-3-methyl-5-hydroxy-6-metoxy-1,4-benzoquinol methylase
MNQKPPSPEKILSYTLQGMATTTTLGAAAAHSLFTHIEKGAGTAEELAKAADISVRGAQALLDAMVALQLVQVAEGKYVNSPEASFYLVEGKAAYLGTHAKMVFSPFGRSFLELPEVVRTGQSRFEQTADVMDNPFWEELVLAIVPLALPVTQALVEHLEFPKMNAPKVLDIGGGSGIFSVALLGANETATATQIDWAAVNRISERFVGRHGVGDRFRTIDGSFKTTDLGEGYDVVIYSNVAHQESPEENTAMFARIKKSLEPGGVLVISDFVLNDDRTPNHPWTGIFHSFMLLQSKAGATWRQADYRSWLAKAGFDEIEFASTMSPSTLIFAR